MFGFDSFTIAVLSGGALVLLIFVAMILLDKGKPASAPASAPTKVANAPAKVAGKR